MSFKSIMAEKRIFWVDSDEESEEEDSESSCDLSYCGLSGSSFESLKPVSPGNQTSTSLRHFEGKLTRTVKYYRELDPTRSKKYVKEKFDLNDEGMVKLKAAMMSIMADWEAYVMNLFKEGFNLFIEKGSGHLPSLSSLENVFPDCKAILAKELKKKFQEESADEVTITLLSAVNTSPSPPWANLFDSFAESTCEKTSFSPIFRCNGSTSGIEKLFSKIFSTNCSSLSEDLLEIENFRYTLWISTKHKIQVTIDDAKTLRDISRLYYGMRCIFAHETKQKTLHGTLKNFPENEEEFSLRDGMAVKYYLKLFQRIKTYGRNAHVSYLTWTNMVEFLKKAAFFLMRAVARWLYEATGGRECIWDYRD